MMEEEKSGLGQVGEDMASTLNPEIIEEDESLRKGQSRNSTEIETKANIATSCEQQKLPRVVVFGKTGAGKSALCSKVVNQEGIFEVGEGLISKTSTFQEHQFDNSFIIIDTVGSSDNRTDFLQTFLDESQRLVTELKRGFNMLLYCIPCTRSRVDRTEINDLKHFGTLYGEGVFEHIHIVITQLDKLKDEEKDETKSKFSKGLPEIFDRNNLQMLNQKSLLFSDFHNFSSFMESFESLLKDSKEYQPQVEDLDFNKPLEALKHPLLKEFLQLKKQEAEEELEFIKDDNNLENMEKAKGDILLFEILLGDKGNDLKALASFLRESAYKPFQKVGRYLLSENQNEQETLIHDIYQIILEKNEAETMLGPKIESKAKESIINIIYSSKKEPNITGSWQKVKSLGTSYNRKFINYFTKNNSKIEFEDYYNKLMEESDSFKKEFFQILLNFHFGNEMNFPKNL